MGTMKRKVKAGFFLMVGCTGAAASVGNATSITPSSTIPCSFNIENFKYDLCPLLGSDIRHLKLTISEDTPPTLTKKTYEISLGGALKRDGTLPAELQCPGGTWICLTVANTRPNHPSEPSRILKVVPVAGSGTDVDQGTGELTPKFKVLRTDNESTPKSKISLRMTLHGGTYTSQKQKAAFVFECDRSRERAERMNGMSSAPRFAWSFNGTHTFEWKSVYACPDTLVPQPPGNGNGNEHETDEDGVNPPADPDSDSGEPVDPTHASHGSVVGPLLWIPSLLLVIYVASKRLFPSAVPRFWPSARWRLGWPFSYRYRSLGGDSGLSQDCDEDGTREYEVDVDIYGYGEIEGEEIPLTPSPRKETFGYGSLR